MLLFSLEILLAAQVCIFLLMECIFGLQSYGDSIESGKVTAYLPKTPILAQNNENFESSNVKRKAVNNVSVQNIQCLHQVRRVCTCVCLLVRV